jgi:hypothetical protein
MIYSSGMQPGVREDILHQSKRNRGTAGTLSQLWSSHSPPNWGAGMPETGSVTSLTGPNHVSIHKIFKHTINAFKSPLAKSV